MAASSTEVTAEANQSKSIFEQDPTPSADPPPPESKSDSAVPVVSTSADSQVVQEQEDSKQEELKQPDADSAPAPAVSYPPNSLNAAKAKFQKTKARVSHQYRNGSPRSKSKPKSSQSSMMSNAQAMMDNVTSTVTSQLMPQLNETGNALMHAADDAVKSLSSSTGIAFAPIDIPLKRRRQTLAVLVWSLMYAFALALNFVAFRYWTGYKFYLYILYLCWKGLFQTFHNDGGLPIPWFRRAFFWKWFTDFFPIRLHRDYEVDADAEGDGDTSYLFGYHPHGIIGMGAVGTFGMMTSGFERLFPGVDVRLLTLKMNFFVPFFDLFITFMGMCDASRDSCNAILGDEDAKSLCLVLGGAKESLEAHADVVRLYLARRKGFVKVALENGAHLVPVFGFGENELFEQVANPKGSIVRRIQNQLQNRMGFAIPLFHGRGIFQYNYGLLPKRIPIDVVFGRPIACPKMTKQQITPEIVDEFHARYCTELKRVFDDNKAKYYRGHEKLPEMEFF